MLTPALPSSLTIIQHPLAGVKLSVLRDVRTPPGEFRILVEQLAALLAVEATRDLSVRSETVRTPLAECAGTAFARPLVLLPILRAGLGMAAGILPFFPHASVGHVGMRRDEKTHLPQCYYTNFPPHAGDADFIVLDPMLATGQSASATITALKETGARRIRFVCFLSVPEGIAHLTKTHPDVRIFTAAIDERLDHRAYIIPGLGDAGDRYFGTLPVG